MTDSEKRYAREWLRKAADRFAFALEKAQLAVRNNDLLTGAVWAQIAADGAFHKHPGFFASAGLEALLVQIARALPEKCSDMSGFDFTAFTGRQKPKLVHVITNGFATGGHSRLLERLVSNSSDRYEHLLVTTAQRGALPERLRKVFCSGRNNWIDLAGSGADLLERSMVLRQFCHRFADAIFLHTHPFDVVPVIAFGVASGPPVVLVNHADHLFWVGTSVADLVADIRAAGQRITVERRHVASTQILPIPLTVAEQPLDRAAARKRFGIADDTVVLLTVANGYKYLPIAGYNFLETIIAVLSRHENALLLACGPNEKGVWAEASQAVNGRIRACGGQANLTDFFAAADVYLDSFPLSSITSLLEAGLCSLPVLGLANTEAPIFSSGALLANDFWPHAQSQEEYRNRIAALITDPELRRTCGSQFRQYIAERHLLPQWRNYFDSIMNSLPEAHSVRHINEDAQQVAADDLYLASIAQVTSARHSLNTSLRKHGGLFPAKERCKMFVKGLCGVDGFRILPVSCYLGKDTFT